MVGPSWFILAIRSSVSVSHFLRQSNCFSCKDIRRSCNWLCLSMALTLSSSHLVLRSFICTLTSSSSSSPITPSLNNRDPSPKTSPMPPCFDVSSNINSSRSWNCSLTCSAFSEMGGMAASLSSAPRSQVNTSSNVRWYPLKPMETLDNGRLLFVSSVAVVFLRITSDSLLSSITIDVSDVIESSRLSIVNESWGKAWKRHITYIIIDFLSGTWEFTSSGSNNLSISKCSLASLNAFSNLA